MATWPADSISSGFVYVTDTAPDSPTEGETWYDLGTNEAKVYDGVDWHLLTVTDHSEVGGVSAGQHRSDANVRTTVDGQVDADTVDGKHASDLGAPGSTQTGGGGPSTWVTIPGVSASGGNNPGSSYTVSDTVNPYDSRWGSAAKVNAQGYDSGVSIDWIELEYASGGSDRWYSVSQGWNTLNIGSTKLVDLVRMQYTNNNDYNADGSLDGLQISWTANAPHSHNI
ncbi:hypothetical protein [Halobacterium rubrum]|uniref:hypothetical protein n=1 Tax=Halobacterium TaxID=2239 RepID=UPI001F2039C4|nr:MULTISPECIES: hypothetical protein [Halobacterium]MDH5019029.1 hypothetical protein [Halobacterium rubrum]